MGVLKGDARLACVDLSNYAQRKHEITKQLMEAATTVGCDLDDGDCPSPLIGSPDCIRLSVFDVTHQSDISSLCRFFYVTGHGMSQEKIDRCFATTEK